MNKSTVKKFVYSYELPTKIKELLKLEERDLERGRSIILNEGWMCGKNPTEGMSPETIALQKWCDELIKKKWLGRNEHLYIIIDW